MVIPVLPAVFLAGTAARVFAALAARAGTDAAIRLTGAALTSASLVESLRVQRDEAYRAPKYNAAGNKSGEGFGKRADEGERVGKPPKKNIKGLRKSKSALGFGKRTRPPRKATAADIRRAGTSSLRRGTKSLAAFIAARYSPEAIAKYNDYAGRLRRSIRLRRQVVEINANTFRVRKHIVQTDTKGNNPYSCTCPDFSQFSEDARTWLGSQAGPFNPCKHMMAVRDRDKDPKEGRWFCANNNCYLDPDAVETDGGYATKAICDSNRRLFSDIPFTGAQCNFIYLVSYTFTFTNKVTLDISYGGDTLELLGPLYGVRASDGQVQYGYSQSDESVSPPYITRATGVKFGANPNDFIVEVTSFTFEPVDPGNTDNCGNPKRECLIESGIRGCTRSDATNYNPSATIEDGSCTFL